MEKILDIDDVLLRLGGNKELCRIIMTEFLNKHLSASDELDELISTNRYGDACALAHTIKGISLNLGANPLSIIAADLEKNLKHPPHDEALLNTQLQQLKETFQLTVQAVQEVVESSATTNSAPQQHLNKDEIRQTVKQAHDCFDTNYAEAMKLIERLCEQIPADQYPSIHQLLNTMRSFNILGARDELQQLADTL